MKSYMKIVTAFFMVFCIVAPVAHANDMGYTAYLEQMNRLNKGSPEKSPRFETSAEVLTDRILDRKNGVMGDVRDIILNQEGEITMLDVELDRLKMGSDRMTLDYKAMQFESSGNGYRMGLGRDQIIEMFPQLLANIPTASGDDGMFSTRNLIGSTVEDSTGHKLGKVKDVLFDQLGGKAKLLFVSMDYRGLRGKGIAIPFNAASYQAIDKTVDVKVNEDLAQAMRDYAKAN